VSTGGGDRAVLLAPGAGASRDHSVLVAIEGALRPVVTRRMDFPYRKAGRKSPDRPEVLVAAVREEAAALAAETGVAADRLVLGGRSLGGRICSMAVAGGLPALGLALVSYPLHPPGRRDKMRTDHFGRLGLPCLFVSGTRDAFGTVEELEEATALIPGPVEHVWLEGGDHGLRRRDDEVAAAVRAWVLALP
jgi:predicted alpha/beta-hydrolase family hydrolase